MAKVLLTKLVQVSVKCVDRVVVIVESDRKRGRGRESETRLNSLLF